MKKLFCKYIILSGISNLFLPKIALAYIGPGTGLSAIGAFLALFVGIIVAFLGFLWYPIKRFLGKKSQEQDQTKNEEG